MSESPPTIDDLRQVGLFGAVNDEVLEFLASKLVVMQAKSGDTVFREGDPARDFFVVMSGEMEVQKRSQSGLDARVALLGPGDWFGEMSVLLGEPRSATIVALSDGRARRLTRDAFEQAVVGDPTHALVLMRQLAGRLRDTDRRLAGQVAP